MPSMVSRAGLWFPSRACRTGVQVNFGARSNCRCGRRTRSFQPGSLCRRRQSSSGSNSQARAVERALSKHLPPLEVPISTVSGQGRPTIAVAMSGGVDSSVAAWLLRDAGFSVFGVHMVNWDQEEEQGMHAEASGHCSAAQDQLDARRTCDALGIQLKQVRFVREYWTDVFQPMVDLYMAGVTPNPDVACNREIKFKCLLEQARLLGADLLATGHYARLHYSAHGTRLLRAKDAAKDQSYFLSSVDGRAFDRVIFPLGGLLKEEVRALAAQAALPTAWKRESMGLCFVGRRRFDRFITDYVPDDPSSTTTATDAAAGPSASVTEEGGQFVCVESGRRLGKHRGLHLYTIGQGAKISGAQVKWYVVRKEATNLIVAPRTDHPSLYTSSLVAGPVHWINKTGQEPGMATSLHGGSQVPRGAPAGLSCSARLRHLQPLSACHVSVPRLSPDTLPSWIQSSLASFQWSEWSEARAREVVDQNEQLIHAVFASPQRAVAPGQILALYHGDACLGSAPILAPGRAP